MAKAVLPRVQAMVLCDGVEESDRERGVYHLKGVRSVISATGFPCIHPRLCAFLQLSGHMGEASCHATINRVETDETLYQTRPRVISFKGPLTIIPFKFRFQNCAFPAPGVYYVQIICENKLISERPLHVTEED
jgi:hypothetical protein